MKNIHKYFFVALALILASCEEETVVDQVFDQTTSGAVLRTIASSTSLIFTDPNPTFSVTLEEQDAQNGALLNRVDMYLTFNDVTPANGDASVPEALVESFSSGEFAPNEIGLPEITITRTLPELAGLLGLSATDYDVSDFFTVRFALVLTDGRVFSNAQASGNLVGGAYFASPYQYSANIVCLSVIPTDVTWSGETVNAAFGVFGANDDVTVTAINASGDYDMTDLTAGFYANFSFNLDQPGTINDFCGNITVTGIGDATQFSIGTSPTDVGFFDEGTQELSVAWYDSGNDIDELSIYTPN